MQRKKGFAFFIVSLLISTIGVGTGTFAWFQVVNTTNAALSGTVIGTGDRLQVGFRVATGISETDCETYDLREDTLGVPGEGFVYWANTTISPETIAFIVQREGYAVNNTVQQITSGSFVQGDTISFYQRPEGLSNIDTRRVPLDNPANKADYIGFTLVFRMAGGTAVSSSEGGSSGVPGYKIHFAESTRFAGTNNVSQALRLGITTSQATDIIAPTESLSGVIPVGGPMDLDGDGIFDFTRPILNDDGSFDNNRYEIAYGEFEPALTDANWGTPSGTAVPASGSNIYFYSAQSYMDAKPLIDYGRKTAAYHTISTYYSTGTPLATTDDAGIAEITFNIWLEGWDHVCTSLVSSSTFGAQMDFVAE